MISPASMGCPILLKFFTWIPKKISHCAIKFKAQCCWIELFLNVCYAVFLIQLMKLLKFCQQFDWFSSVATFTRKLNISVVYTNFQISTSWQHCTEIFTDLFTIWTGQGHIKRIKSGKFRQVLSQVNFNFRKRRKKTENFAGPPTIWRPCRMAGSGIPSSSASGAILDEMFPESDARLQHMADCLCLVPWIIAQVLDLSSR